MSLSLLLASLIWMVFVWVVGGLTAAVFSEALPPALLQPCQRRQNRKHVLY